MISRNGDDLYRNDGISVREEREHQRYGKSTWKECMKESSTEDSDRKLSKSWLSMREYLYGTD